MFCPRNFAPVRLLLALPAMVLGGSQRVYLTLMQHLDRNRVEPHLAVVEATGLFLPSVPRDVPIHNLRVRHARNAVWPLIKLCRELRPHVILSCSAHLNAAVVMARRFMPAYTVVIAREGADITAPEQHVSRLRLRIYKQIYRRADIVICQSEYMKDKFVREFGLPLSKLACIYNPVDIDSIRETARFQSPFSNAGPNLVYAGRLSWEKGIDLLLQSMPLVCKAVPGSRLTILGEGPDTARLFYLRHDLGLESCVRFVGEVRNPYPYLSNAACVVLPSRTEALPNVALEAIALGVPVVSTNCSGALDEISATTQFLNVLKERDPESLAKGITDCLRHQTKKAKCIEPAFVARFGVKAVVKQYESLILRSAEQSHPVPATSLNPAKPDYMPAPEA